MVAMSLVHQLFGPWPDPQFQFILLLGPWSDPQFQFIFLVTALATERISHLYVIVGCRCLQLGMNFSVESSV